MGSDSDSMNKSKRKLSTDDMQMVEQEMMPGFTLSWNYNQQLEPEATFSKDNMNKLFVRYN